MSKHIERKMKKLDIAVMKRLIKLRNKLDAVSQISWSFSILNKQHPIGNLTEKEAEELTTAYKELIEELQKTMGN